MALRALRPESSGPISSKEFSEAVTNLWGIWRGASVPSRIGLAVSGGADSMALAFLCKQLISERLIPDLKVKPFIVDHLAREGSTEEAHKVADWLKDLGFDPSILTLSWPGGAHPSSFTDFETVARKLRYQILGKACRDYNSRALFLGHHLDDNVETVLSRIARGQRQATGLKGVTSVGHIPECHGIYGVAESGSSVRLVNVQRRVKSAGARDRDRSSKRLQLDRSTSGPPHHFREDFILPIAEGGIYLFRPLNSFSKSRLTSTCLQNNIQFVNDRTNFDPTLTSRNTVRHLLFSGVLPRALRAPSILQLIENCQRISNELIEETNAFLEKIRVLKLDLRTGSLVIDFPGPRVMEDFGMSQGVSIQSSSPKLQRTLAMVLRRLVDIVSPAPKSDIPLEKFTMALQTVFPTLKSASGETSASSIQDIFTVGGVKFEPVTASSQWAGAKVVPLKSFVPRKQNNGYGSNTWLLSRPPYSRRVSRPISTFDLQLFNLSTAKYYTDTSRWSPWQLWDNRHWIRVRAEPANLKDPAEKDSFEYNGMNIPVVVRPMDGPDLSDVRRRLVKYTWFLSENETDAMKSDVPSFPTLKSRPQLDDLLQNHAPDDLRYTIPVIAEATGRKRVLAFPSFGYRMPVIFTRRMGHNNDRRDHWTLNWQINYKHIDLDLLNLVSRDLDKEISQGAPFKKT
ncbi:tRNA(Ile)-lysidine synthetase [Blastomyces percursus]|uniref:tRNA(Ile)-lysidine synthetase n=1 Tax=Blastomyces percursus TaxID=1658174 RepID=A0A1J9QGD0_9EURO|nr:tRNA(Ile)-lysidine synthetase [Blastomyces percursus]